MFINLLPVETITTILCLLSIDDYCSAYEVFIDTYELDSPPRRLWKLMKKKKDLSLSWWPESRPLVPLWYDSSVALSVRHNHFHIEPLIRQYRKVVIDADVPASHLLKIVSKIGGLPEAIRNQIQLAVHLGDIHLQKEDSFPRLMIIENNFRIVTSIKNLSIVYYDSKGEVLPNVLQSLVNAHNLRPKVNYKYRNKPLPREKARTSLRIIVMLPNQPKATLPVNLSAHLFGILEERFPSF